MNIARSVMNGSTSSNSRFASDRCWRRVDERVGLVDCGSIPRTACELRSFSFIERRLLCWVGRAVRFRLVFDDAEREERVVLLRVVYAKRKELCLGSRAVRFRLGFDDFAAGERSNNAGELALPSSAGCSSAGCVCFALTKARKRMEKFRGNSYLCFL